jgi:hypothetical protein
MVRGLFLLQILRMAFVQGVYSVDPDATPYEAVAPSLVTEQEHGENEAPWSTRHFDVWTKRKKTAAKK